MSFNGQQNVKSVIAFIWAVPKCGYIYIYIDIDRKGEEGVRDVWHCMDRIVCCCIYIYYMVYAVNICKRNACWIVHFIGFIENLNKY